MTTEEETGGAAAATGLTEQDLTGAVAEAVIAAGIAGAAEIAYNYDDQAPMPEPEPMPEPNKISDDTYCT